MYPFTDVDDVEAYVEVDVVKLEKLVSTTVEDMDTSAEVVVETWVGVILEETGGRGSDTAIGPVEEEEATDDSGSLEALNASSGTSS